MNEPTEPDHAGSSTTIPLGADLEQEPLPEVDWWLPSFIPRYFDVPLVAEVHPSAVVRLDPSFARFNSMIDIREELKVQRNK